jgi:hypothetical protein
MNFKLTINKVSKIIVDDNSKVWKSSISNIYFSNEEWKSSVFNIYFSNVKKNVWGR